MTPTVILFTDDLTRGGAADVIMRLALDLDSKGVKVIIVSLFQRANPSNTSPMSQETSKVAIMKLGLIPPWAIGGLIAKLKWINSFFLSSISFTRLFQNSLKINWRTTILNSHSVFGNIFLLPQKIIFQRNIVLSRHSTLDQRSENPTLGFLDHFASSIADATTTYSQDNASIFMSTDNIAKEKIYTIPYLIDLTGYNASLRELDVKRKMVFIHIGNLKPVKNQVLILNAAKFLMDKNIDFEINILGDGPMEDALKDLAEDLGLTKMVHFLGHVQDVWPYLCSADAFVLTSNREGSNLSLRQAIISGCAVISTDVGDAKVFSQNAAIIIPPRDQVALNNAMYLLASDEQELHFRMGIARNILVPALSKQISYLSYYSPVFEYVLPNVNFH